MDIKNKFIKGMTLLSKNKFKKCSGEAMVEFGVFKTGSKYAGTSCVLNPLNAISVFNKLYYKDTQTASTNTLKVDIPFFNTSDSLDWKNFWKICKEYFPLHSVNGGAASKWDVSRWERGYVTEKIKSSITDLQNKTVLEIGYGYGYTGIELIERYNVDYYGIDYVSSNPEDTINKEYNGKHRFFEINESGIPKELRTKKYDIIFSFNVFQHLTKEQREEYIKQMSECLADDGVILFDCFEWGLEGETPREDFNTKFFGVLTSIDSAEEMKNIIESNGLAIKTKDCSHRMNKDTIVPLYHLVKVS